MISRMGLLKRKEGTTQEEFKDYWLNVHGPIAAEMKNLRHYSQHAVCDNEHRHPLGQGPIIIDGYSELQFDSYGDMVEGVMSLDGKGADDVPKFADPHNPILVCVKKFVKHTPKYLLNGDKPLIKRVSFMGRAEGVSAEEWMYQWWDVHTEMVHTMRGYVGYAQNLVIDRIVNGVSVHYDELPVEGVVEFWFENMDAFNECYDSPEFKRTSQHGSEFIGAINTYLTEVHDIL